ncbi:MAG: hypothetical protein QG597_865 [Actinomycetota bacterium]|nr:hypothetical protein [Actinomycetota bacterium]
MTETQGSWQVGSDSQITLKTSRIGLFAIHAHAPVTDGVATIADGSVTLEFSVAIDQVTTGNPLLDPEVHALVHSGSDGRLVFRGEGGSLAELTGEATAGNISVPLELCASPTPGSGSMDVKLNGKTEFRDIHLPLPGMGHIKQVDVDIDGLLTLMRKTANT